MLKISWGHIAINVPCRCHIPIELIKFSLDRYLIQNECELVTNVESKLISDTHPWCFLRDRCWRFTQKPNSVPQTSEVELFWVAQFVAESLSTLWDPCGSFVPIRKGDLAVAHMSLQLPEKKENFSDKILYDISARFSWSSAAHRQYCQNG